MNSKNYIARLAAFKLDHMTNFYSGATIQGTPSEPRKVSPELSLLMINQH